MAGNIEKETASAEQIAEIADVKCAYPGRVRVIADVGEFTRVVTVQPAGEIDVHIKFQLSGKYPTVTPTIFIRSSAMTAEQNATLTGHLQSEAETRIGQSVISELMTSCVTWLKENDIEAIKSDGKKGNKKKSNRKTNVKVKEPKDTLTDDTSSKKPPMKTAADVIKRLQWDPSLHKEEFRVGYMDRIVGLVEKDFTAFTWEDLASVDHFSLAIPQHRIQYFKYKSEKVWDKNERLDNVFGSTGSKITIIEAIEKFNANERENQLNANENEQVADENEQSSDENNDDEAGDDAAPAVQEDKENGEGTSNEDVQDKTDGGANAQSTSTDSKTEQKMATRRFRPNYFVALPVTNADLVRQLVQVQDQIESMYPQYQNRRYRIPTNGFHLTLAVMQLATQEDERACAEAMIRVERELLALSHDAGTLSFRGIGYFSPKVLIAKVDSSPYLLEIVEKIRRSLHRAGIEVEDNQFNAHITLFKVPKREQFPNDRLELGELAAAKLGSQVIDNIQVCRMGPVSTTGSEFCYRNIWSKNLASD